MVFQLHILLVQLKQNKKIQITIQLIIIGYLDHKTFQIIIISYVYQIVNKILQRQYCVYKNYTLRYYQNDLKEYQKTSHLAAEQTQLFFFFNIFYLGHYFLIEGRGQINLSVSNYLQLLNNKQGMMRLNLVCLMLLFILKIQCLQLQKHQGVQHDQQVIVAVGSAIGTAFLADKIKFVYFLLLMVLAIYVNYTTLKITENQFDKTFPYNLQLSQLMSKQGNGQTNVKLKFISAELEVINQDEPKLKFPIIDSDVVEDEIFKITKKIEVMQWRQTIDSMRLFKQNQITFFGLLNYFTHLQWADKNEGIRGGKINDSNNWKLKNESLCKKIQLKITHKDGQTYPKKLDNNLVSKLLSNYNKGQRIKLPILEEEQKQRIRYNIIHEIIEFKYMKMVKFLQAKSVKNNQIVQNVDKKKFEQQIMNEIVQKTSLNFDENFIYLLPRQNGQDQSYGALRISFQAIKLQVKQKITEQQNNIQYINFLAIYNEQKQQIIEIYKKDYFQCDVIIGKNLTKEKYFQSLYWKKNNLRLIVSLYIGLFLALGNYLGLFGLKMIVENHFINSLCQPNNLFMVNTFFYYVFMLIIAIRQLFLSFIYYHNITPNKNLFYFLIVLSFSFIVIIIKSEQGQQVWNELNTAYKSQS